MEVRKTGLFLIVSLGFLFAMAAVIFIFGRNPMGIDFTTFTEINPQEYRLSPDMVDKRVVATGTVRIVDRRMYFDIYGNRDVISYIQKRYIPMSGGKTELIDMSSNDFTIRSGNSVIRVNGQPQQIVDPKSIINNPKNPDIFIETIRDKGTYAVFGTVLLDAKKKPFILPYRVTTESIQQVKNQSAAANRKDSFNRYITIFLSVAAYIIILWQTGAIVRVKETDQAQIEENSK